MADSTPAKAVPAAARVLHLIFKPNIGRRTEYPKGHVMHGFQTPGAICSEMCGGALPGALRKDFPTLLAERAAEAGLVVKKHTVNNLDEIRTLRAQVAAGKLAPGPVAVLLHAWDVASHTAECIPSWEYYPLLAAFDAKRHPLLYPAPRSLEHLHTAKRYSSKYMPPTRHIDFGRDVDGKWRFAEGRDGGAKGAPATGARLVAAVRRALGGIGRAKGQRALLKWGFSWDGWDVRTFSAGNAEGIAAAVERKLKRLAPACTEQHLMLQEQLALAAEIRYVVMDGVIRGPYWHGLPSLSGCTEGKTVTMRVQDLVNEPGQGAVPYKHALARMNELGVIKGGVTNAGCSPAGPIAFSAEFRRNRMRYELQLAQSHVVNVLGEMRRDNGGALPMWARIDLLISRDGSVYLGERESWGAGFYEGKFGGYPELTYPDVADAMVRCAERNCRGDSTSADPFRILRAAAERQGVVGALPPPRALSPAKRRAAVVAPKAKRRKLKRR